MTAADLNVLAQAASFGDISVFTLVPPARTVATVSKTYREKCRRARERLISLVTAGALIEGYAALRCSQPDTNANRTACG
jgi:hypothetical protein